MFYRVKVHKIEMFNIEATSRGHALSIAMESYSIPYMKYVEDFHIESINKNEYEDEMAKREHGETGEEVSV